LIGRRGGVYAARATFPSVRKFAGYAMLHGGVKTPPYSAAAPWNRGMPADARGPHACGPYDRTGNGNLQFPFGIAVRPWPAREGGRGFRSGARMSGPGRHGPGLG